MQFQSCMYRDNEECFKKYSEISSPLKSVVSMAHWNKILILAYFHSLQGKCRLMRPRQCLCVFECVCLSPPLQFLTD
jgi:hypothetical protein